MTIPVAILAGGKATRLGSLAACCPKSLLDVAGKPFAVHQIELLKEQGYTDLVFCVGHLGKQIEHTLGNGSRWHVSIQYSYDGEDALGTGGAIFKARSLLGEEFFVLNGDSYLPSEYSAIEKAFFEYQKAGLMTVYHNLNRWDQSNVIFQSNLIIAYDKCSFKPGMEYIDYGLSAFHARAFEGYDLSHPFDLSRVLQDLQKKNELAGFEVHERFYEIGSPEGYRETTRCIQSQGNVQ